MTTVAELKSLLVETIHNQITNGVQKVTKQGDVVTVDAEAPLLAVAAKVVKDWSHEIDTGTVEGARVEKLSNYLAARRPTLVPKAS
ncbi:MAG: hypothetical protein P4M09_22840 [Devosia sp.]|nr:hypothetical protein [Devosia sp.]